jgi:hypothetical protein
MGQDTPLDGRIELHGWDSRSQEWHGPDEITFKLVGSRRLLDRLRELHGCWHGKLSAQAPGSPSLTFCAQTYDLGDSGLATIDMEGSPGGPLEVLLVVPPSRRSEARPELAFEFTSYLRFLEGRVSHGSELAMHDYVERILRDTAPETTIVISVETRFVAPEVHELIASAAEKLAMSLIAWMAEKDLATRQAR